MRISQAKLVEAFGTDNGRVLVELFSRRVLSERQSLLCSAACLQATGQSSDLTSLLYLVLGDPKTLGPVYETLLQGYLFCGYPRAIESFFCLDNVLRRRGLSLEGIPATPLDSPGTLIERGRATARKVHRDKFGRINNKISAISPDLGYLMLAEGYGHILCRPGLDMRARELAILSSLTALGALRQLNSHFRGAINIGCSAAEAIEAVLSCYPWTGHEMVRKAAAVWIEVTGGDVKAHFPAYKWI